MSDIAYQRERMLFKCLQQAVKELELPAGSWRLLCDTSVHAQDNIRYVLQLYTPGGIPYNVVVSMSRYELNTYGGTSMALQQIVADLQAGVDSYCEQLDQQDALDALYSAGDPDN